MASNPTPGDPGPSVDTIAALSTPPGVGAVAVVRLSGPRAFRVLRAVAPELEELPAPRAATLVTVHDGREGERVDRALATCFPGPASYTGEDVVELSGHGGWLTPELVLEACLAAGARRAEPGEFTRRAYLNGKMDLVQAEAVVDMVEGRSRALHRAALHQLERGLSARIAELREGLVELEALLVHHIDFPEEDEPPVPLEGVVARGRELAGRLRGFLETAPEGELLRAGALAVLAGRPNSGKSSLFNALIGEERAIVTERPGTTRDAIEASVSLGGFPFRLVDTAGLRETDEPVEVLGVEVARRYLGRADVVLFCAEAGRGLGNDERAFLEDVEVPVVEVRTKLDRMYGREERPAGSPLPSPGARPVEEGPSGRGEGEGGRSRAGGAGPASGNGGTVGRPRRAGDGDGSSTLVEVSVVTGEGLGRLRERLPTLVYRGLVGVGGDAPVLTRERHRRAVARAHEEVVAFIGALEGGVPAEVATAHLRPAETALEEVLGIITEDEVLDWVFREFCIGK